MGEIYPEDEKGEQPKKPHKGPKPPTILDQFGTNVSKLADEDKLDPVVGRTEEVARMVQILGRRRKNNPVLVGPPGVGKCVTSTTKIKVRKTKTGEVAEVTIGEFKKMIKDDPTV